MNKPLENLAILAAIIIAWQRFGFGLKGFTGVAKVYPPKSEIGPMGQAEWQLKYGGSYRDYQDWLAGV